MKQNTWMHPAKIHVRSEGVLNDKKHLVNGQYLYDCKCEDARTRLALIFCHGVLSQDLQAMLDRNVGAAAISGK